MLDKLNNNNKINIQLNIELINELLSTKSKKKTITLLLKFEHNSYKINGNLKHTTKFTNENVFYNITIVFSSWSFTQYST